MKFTSREIKIAVIAGIVLSGVIVFLIISKDNRPLSEVQQINRPLLDSLPKKSNDTIDTRHISPSLTPPTNHWFSGLALNAQSKAVFPLPLSFKSTETGFSFGLPTVTSTTNTITGGYTPDISLELGADTYKVIRYDSVSVTLAYFRADSEIAELTLAEGSPYISLTARQPVIINLKDFTRASDKIISRNIGDKQYGISSEAALSYINGSLSLKKDEVISLFATAKGMDIMTMAQYAHRLEAVRVRYLLSESEVSTTLSYRTTQDQPTLYVALPGQQPANAKKLAATYTTIFGTLDVYMGTEFESRVQKINPGTALSLKNLSNQRKNQLIEYLKVDADNTNIQKTDTYFGGKELYRAANLYQLARQLGQAQIASSLKTQLTAALNDWFDPKGSDKRANRYFYYDLRARGIVGQEASFGSEQFNDHHFQYGYFIYAAAILSEADRSLAKKYQPMVRLLAEDIAAPIGSADFPKWRMFDPYSGHSWASGYGQFDDGNNQESSSEAIMAWTGLAAWSATVNDTQLERQSIWMLSRESDAAARQWTAPDLSEFPGYTRRTVGINWGGKRDYATFFSAESAAVFGIQLIPLTPNMADPLSVSKKNITENLKATIPNSDFARQFGDYLLMYRSLVDQPAALNAATSLPDSNIDGANSRSYMMAWILSKQE